MKPASVFFKTLIALAFAFSAYAAQPEPQPPQPVPPQPAPQPPQPVPPQPEPPAPQPAPLTEAQVLGLLSTINEAEIDAGLLAEQRGEALRVTNLATKLVEVHSAWEDRVDQFEDRMGEEQDSTDAEAIENHAEEVQRNLENVRSEDFDIRFIDSQVAMHSVFLMKLDDSMIPSVQDPELMEFVKEVRVQVKKNFDRARSVQEDLNEED